MYVLRLTATLILVVGFASTSAAQSFEPRIDRPGGDFANIQLGSLVCRSFCLQDPQCRAWTYVRPGIQAEEARCYLKNIIPPPQFNNCCVSGVR
jgi:hypothetical protein